MMVHDLSGSLEPLQQWFNQDKDSARVVAINSAT